MTTLISGGAGWVALPVVMVRQAGFPLVLLEPLADPDLGAGTARLRDAEATARRAGEDLREALRGQAESATVAARTGMLAAVPAGVPGAGAYRAALAGLGDEWHRFETAHRAALERGRRAVVDAFRGDPALREVLLLSNDAHYPRFAEWLAGADRELSSRTDRRMADLLCRYLQRVTAKNETTAHFGPVSAAVLAGPGDGPHWSDLGAGRRVGFFTHWAAQALGSAFAAEPDLREHLRPRRFPLAFVDGRRLRRYAPLTRTGLLADWRFDQVDDETVEPEQAWLLGRCDGERTLAELRGQWPGPDSRLDALLAGLVDRGWLVVDFEIPVGEPDPLAALRAALPPPGGSPAAARAHQVITDFEKRLADFVAAEHPDRATLLEAMKAAFTEVTGRSANRGDGRIYADRSIVFEECHSRAGDFTLGPDLARLITDDLAPGYRIALAGARLRMAAEGKVLTEWVTDRFGTHRDIPLADFYAGYVLDRSRLDERCRAVDDEVDAVERHIADSLLADADLGQPEVEVTPERLDRLVAGLPERPAAVCNPDIMLAATSADAIRAGDYRVVVGECHALRELLCHSSLSPLLAERVPELAELAYEAYQGLLEPDEILCDLARSHPNKTAAQLRFPCPDLEITGRSGKPRAAVIQPDRLYLRVRDGRLGLYAHGVPQRLRLLTSPAGGRSIRQDPLAPFAFPRHFGGISIPSSLPHVPRIRSGRLVLRRQTWRVPAERIWRPAGGAGGTGDAAQFRVVQELRERLRLPRHVFVKLPDEPKPMYVDLDSALLVRQLCRSARQATEPAEFSEMLPDPEQLWLRVEGRRYTTELRCAVFSGPARLA
ncbi:lantibiotic dehydratase [Micromonospora sp. NPDC050495]|uniref:lantibiotic dehydratase n=1 Tax=Micromonospora sp. NPDC050495 TaxID=3154936 RepID=UPI0033C2F72E